MSFHKEIKNAIVAQFGSELAAGKHKEFPLLRQLWVEAEAERAERVSLEQACFEVFNRADRNWLEN